MLPVEILSKKQKTKQQQNALVVHILNQPKVVRISSVLCLPLNSPRSVDVTALQMRTSKNADPEFSVSHGMI